MSAWRAWITQLLPRPDSGLAEAAHRQAVLESIHLLSIEEWLLLVYCVQRNQQTIALEVVHPAAGALVAKGLLVRSGSIGHGAAWPYTVPDFVWKYLHDRPGLLHQQRGIMPDDPKLEEHLARLDKHLRCFDLA